MEPEKKEILFNMGTSPYGKALREYLSEEKEKIGNIKDVNSWEETQGRQYAIKLIEKLFSFLDGKNPEQNNKNKYY